MDCEKKRTVRSHSTSNICFYYYYPLRKRKSPRFIHWKILWQENIPMSEVLMHIKYMFPIFCTDWLNNIWSHFNSSFKYECANRKSPFIMEVSAPEGHIWLLMVGENEIYASNMHLKRSLAPMWYVVLSKVNQTLTELRERMGDKSGQDPHHILRATPGVTPREDKPNLVKHAVCHVHLLYIITIQQPQLPHTVTLTTGAAAEQRAQWGRRFVSRKNKPKQYNT